MQLYHVCFAVQDLDAAMSDLSATTGARWRAPRTGTLGEWTYRIVFSVAAPHFELIEGPPGSPWDCTTGPRFHHLGFWSDNMDLDRTALDGVGQTVFDACPLGRPFSYHRIDSIGANIELVDRSAEPGFRTTWDL
ncbi:MULTISPECIES: VOC family protein [Nocardiaceae]|uniref:VOC family protein n=1 Tax=Nocardiaceae TaxID=85025 RepID=UPI00050BDF15|nr:VOC family protein [Rhodococcus fascians]